MVSPSNLEVVMDCPGVARNKGTSSDGGISGEGDHIRPGVLGSELSLGDHLVSQFNDVI